LALNRVEVSGRVEALEPMRMTPAGIPTRRFTIAHESRQLEAGMTRKVECRLRIVAIGEIAEQAGGFQDGLQVEVAGFLAKASYRSEWPVVHATRLTVI
jgi:primosomal replication protein N